MVKKLMVVLGCAGLLGVVGLVALFALISRDVWWHQDLVFKRLGTRARVDLNGLGAAELPVTFKPVGRVGPHTRPIGGRGEDSLGTPEAGSTRVTWRFVQGQYNDLGGYAADPALIDISLFDPALAPAELETVRSTTMNRFYSPSDDAPDFATLAWERTESSGAATTRALGMDDHYQAGNPPRWLVIHVDPERRLRLDLFAWKSTYSLDSAMALAQSVAASVRPAAGLAGYFARRGPAESGSEE